MQLCGKRDGGHTLGVESLEGEGEIKSVDKRRSSEVGRASQIVEYRARS